MASATMRRPSTQRTIRPDTVFPFPSGSARRTPYSFREKDEAEQVAMAILRGEDTRCTVALPCPAVLPRSEIRAEPGHRLRYSPGQHQACEHVRACSAPCIVGECTNTAAWRSAGRLIRDGPCSPENAPQLG
jgi:hypothetical protein